jgi:hypothetical protein
VRETFLTAASFQAQWRHGGRLGASITPLL